MPAMPRNNTLVRAETTADNVVLAASLVRDNANERNESLPEIAGMKLISCKNTKK